MAQQFGRLLGKEVKISGEENGRAYLNNAGQCLARFGYPSVPLGRIIGDMSNTERVLVGLDLRRSAR